MKKALLVFFVTVIILIIALAAHGAYWLFQNSKSKPLVPTATLEAVPEKVTKNTDVLTVDIAYPTVPGTGKEVEDVNTSIKAEIDKRIAAFEIEAKDSMNAEIDLPKDIKSSVIGSPSVEEKNARYVSIYMGMEWYLRGSAHPSHTIDTYIFDYQNKKVVAVSDLFKQEANYLVLLSKLSKEDLIAQSKQGDMGYMYDEAMVIDGTAPRVNNFSKMLPTKDGIVIYFDEYQVAPYAAGPQQVTIPYAKLKEIINPDGVIGTYKQ